MNTLTAPAPATAKQIAFIESLMKSRATGKTYVGTQLRSLGIDTLDALTKHDASNIIGVLLDEPVTAVEKKSPTFAKTEPGFYGDANGTVWQVKESKAGNTYAMELVTEVVETCGGCEHCDGENLCQKTKGTFVYHAGAMKNANTWQPLTLDMAAAYGKETGVCCMCGRTLTNPDSIAAGIGPICAGGF